MSCVQLSQRGLPVWIVVPVIRSCQSPIRMWLVNAAQVSLHTCHTYLTSWPAIARLCRR